MFAENLVLRIIGLLTAVAVIAAIGIFIVKPIVDTTNNAFEQFGGLQENILTTFQDAGIENIDIPDTSSPKLDKLKECVQRAGQDVEQLQRCANRFQK